MRILVAPDSFGGAVTAVEAARAIAAGWQAHAPADDLVLAPMSSGGAGLVGVIEASLGGELLAVTVRGADVDGGEVPATVLMVDDVGFVESAQACGSDAGRRDPETATSYGVGQLVAAAVDAGARRVVVGLGDSAVGDGGAGMLAALGAVSNAPGALLGGPRALASLTEVDLRPIRDRVAGVTLVGASDLDIPLLGLRGVTNRTGVSRGIAPDRLQAVDAQLERLADATDRQLAGAAGAGAGGGTGFAVMLAGGSCSDGVAVVADAIRLPELARSADLVVTGEASFDFESRSGTVPGGVAAISGAAVRPCIALAGRVLVGARETRALGIESAYGVDELVGADDGSMAPAQRLSALAARVARTWSR
jgi:glycerate kinase